MPRNTNWTVTLSNQARKQKKKLPKTIQETLLALLYDLEATGPEVSGWHNYGKLTGRKGFFHCHLNKGKPRYVAVWKLESDTIKLMEVKYVGTHEGINCNRIG